MRFSSPVQIIWMVKAIKRSSISYAIPHRGNTIVAHCASGGKHCNTAYSPGGAAQMPKTFKRPTESFVKEIPPIVHFVSLVPKRQHGNVLEPEAHAPFFQLIPTLSMGTNRNCTAPTGLKQ